MINTEMLIGGIVALIIGIIIYAARTYIPPTTAQKIAVIGAIILSILGITLIVLSFILPLVGYP